MCSLSVRKTYKSYIFYRKCKFRKSYIFNRIYKVFWNGSHPQHLNPNHPYIDCQDPDERNIITKIFNDKLEFIAKKENYIFISLFKNLIDNPNNYFLNDTIHIKPSNEILDQYIYQIKSQL